MSFITTYIVILMQFKVVENEDPACAAAAPPPAAAAPLPAAAAPPPAAAAPPAANVTVVEF